MSDEKNLWALFKKHLPYEVHSQRIETGGTGLGIPDVNLCGNGMETWVELKVVKGRRVMLSPEQVVWHFRRARAGGSSWILARDKADGVRKGKYDRIYLWPGSAAKDVAEHGIKHPAQVFEAPFDWPAIIVGSLGLERA